MKKVNDLRLQIDSKETISCIDCQGKSFNTNIAEVQAQKVFFWPLGDIELVDWTTTNKFARLWFCEEIHHSSILYSQTGNQKSNSEVYQLEFFKQVVSI